ncbi:endonuclease VII domain-containing protein [Dactylosporangium sucinum]|uniref:endonuclease VII domain-containing protein n=1 Tax=Dactylosporangium sucinum TaxID=1424081 RepID=UPI00167D4F9C|nr:endonuclease VII domain-containing protein [Dactylosporangium sucinum]
MTKQCRTCGETKPIADFYRNPATVRSGGHRPDCKACTSTARRKRYADTGGIEAHRQVLRYAYGMRPEDYAAKLAEQNGVCAVCGTVEVATYKGRPRRLAVDHDHVTGKVRALLCQRCNLLVGAIEQNPALVELAAAYLRQHGA